MAHRRSLPAERAQTLPTEACDWLRQLADSPRIQWPIPLTATLWRPIPGFLRALDAHPCFPQVLRQLPHTHLPLRST